MKDCPCGQPAPFTDCCGPYLRGTATPDTAEDLMRSRYTAHFQKNWGYLLKTLCAEERRNESLKEIDQETEWVGLEITGTQGGTLEDQEGEVRFIARYREDDEEKLHEETARFLRENGRWVYTAKRSIIHRAGNEPAASVQTFVRDRPKVGRNDPCPCGSGKKYKKCCGA